MSDKDQGEENAQENWVDVEVPVEVSLNGQNFTDSGCTFVRRIF